MCVCFFNLVSIVCRRIVDSDPTSFTHIELIIFNNKIQFEITLKAKSNFYVQFSSCKISDFHKNEYGGVHSPFHPYSLEIPKNFNTQYYKFFFLLRKIRK